MFKEDLRCSATWCHPAATLIALASIWIYLKGAEIIMEGRTYLEDILPPVVYGRATRHGSPQSDKEDQNHDEYTQDNYLQTRIQMQLLLKASTTNLSDRSRGPTATRRRQLN